MIYENLVKTDDPLNVSKPWFVIYYYIKMGWGYLNILTLQRFVNAVVQVTCENPYY